jgi:heme-degrading monooxygenase HmoA
MTVYVALRVYLRPGEEKNFEQAYHEVSSKLRGNIPGQLSDELLRPVTKEEPYILLSQWESVHAHQAWTATTQHRDDVMPLRQHWTHTKSQEYLLVATTEADQEGGN